MATRPTPSRLDIDQQVMRLEEILDCLVHTWPVPPSQPLADPWIPNDGAQNVVDGTDQEVDLD
ncbi:UNVERIFIED_CONTAM: hypothetical protein Sradi_2679800 [Sesamum radiatum]|uniref:Uncharacterized protein n=1 Tax=Sesamum radiatum TaxID=300843 RepID=A0AAW2S637_SESRA